MKWAGLIRRRRLGGRLLFEAFLFWLIFTRALVVSSGGCPSLFSEPLLWGTFMRVLEAETRHVSLLLDSPFFKPAFCPSLALLAKRKRNIFYIHLTYLSHVFRQYRSQFKYGDFFFFLNLKSFPSHDQLSIKFWPLHFYVGWMCRLQKQFQSVKKSGFHVREWLSYYRCTACRLWFKNNSECLLKIRFSWSHQDGELAFGGANIIGLGSS